VSARERFSAAIGRVGVRATLYKEGAAGSFTACLRPGAPADATVSVTGRGDARRCLLYAAAGGPGDGMARGDTVALLGERYYVRGVEPLYLRGICLCHKAVVQACRGEG